MIDDYGIFVGRFYLIIVVDVVMSVIIGFCLIFECLFWFLVVLCFVYVICSKDNWLVECGIVYFWVMYGCFK